MTALYWTAAALSGMSTAALVPSTLHRGRHRRKTSARTVLNGGSRVMGEVIEAVAWYGIALAVTVVVIFPPLVRGLAKRDARRTEAEYTAGHRTLR